MRKLLLQLYSKSSLIGQNIVIILINLHLLVSSDHFFVEGTNNVFSYDFILVMLTDGQNSETVEAAEILKSLGHIIMVVTDGVNKRRNLIKMVSNQMDNSPLLFSLNTFEDLEEMNKYINSEVLQNLTVFCKFLWFSFFYGFHFVQVHNNFLYSRLQITN